MYVCVYIYIHIHIYIYIYIYTHKLAWSESRGTPAAGENLYEEFTRLAENRLAQNTSNHF